MAAIDQAPQPDLVLPPQAAEFVTRTGRSLMPRAAFISQLGAAVTNQVPFAVGKLGGSEKTLLYYLPFLQQQPSRLQRLAYEGMLRRHSFLMGLFPYAATFLMGFASYYAEQVNQLDMVGLGFFSSVNESDLFQHYQFAGQLVSLLDQEPDRSLPSNEANCWLPYLRGKRLLILCPFARVLAERANQETFERVWAKSGKRWFYPADVAAVEFPYGFSPATQARYGDIHMLREEIMTDVAAHEFDVALIAAGGGLNASLAVEIKQMGKVAVILGGHLQALFGVLGNRWRQDAIWREQYINDWWIDLPPHYVPAEAAQIEHSCYW